MTLISLRNSTRDGELPPGMVDGFCPRCRRERLAAEDDPRCADCGVSLHPLSLPSVRNGGQAGQPEAKPANPTKETANAERAPQKSVRLRASREAAAWDRATDALLAAAEREEREAEAVYQQAKARYDVARQEAHKLRQLRELVRVDDQQPALAAPTTTGKRWARKHDACVNCGRNDVQHAGKGRCAACALHFKKHGQERPTRTPEDTHDGN